jgi:hypothetical protein
MSFKYTENELQRVANEMYRLMTKGSSSILDYFPAFKQAQSFVNPRNIYSTNFPNKQLMKELHVRVNKLFANLKNKPEVKVVIDVSTSQLKVKDIMKKLHDGAGKSAKINNESVTVKITKIVCPLIESVNKPLISKTRKLLTGNTVEELDEPVEIVISTICPRKWVLVDLETGEQYSSLGMNSVTKLQSFVKPIRRVVIPKPLKKNRS